MSQEHDIAWTQCLAAELKLRLRKRNTVLVLVDKEDRPDQTPSVTQPNKETE